MLALAPSTLATGLWSVMLDMDSSSWKLDSVFISRSTRPGVSR
jgi:hypothetical protein